MPNNKLFEKSQEVQTRYWNRKTHGWSEATIKPLIRRWFRLKNYRKEANILKNYNDGIKLVAETTRKLKSREVESSCIVYNAALYLLLANRDIQALKLDALSHSNVAVRQLATRVILLTILELDLSKVTGPKFRSALADINCTDQLKSEITQCLRNVRNSHKSAKTRLVHLRVNTIAHRDADALKQYDLIEGIDENKVIGDCSSFLHASTKFLTLLRQAVEKSNELPSLVKQIARKIDAEQKNDKETTSV